MMRVTMPLMFRGSSSPRSTYTVMFSPTIVLKSIASSWEVTSTRYENKAEICSSPRMLTTTNLSSPRGVEMVRRISPSASSSPGSSAAGASSTSAAPPAAASVVVDEEEEEDDEDDEDDDDEDDDDEDAAAAVSATAAVAT